MIGPAPLPLLPTDDLDLARFGALQDDLGMVLGGLLGTAGNQALSNPQVQAALTATADACKDKAQQGVEAWVTANKDAILAYTAGVLGVLLIGHFALSVIALNLAFPRRAFSDLRASLGGPA